MTKCKHICRLVIVLLLAAGIRTGAEEPVAPPAEVPVATPVEAPKPDVPIEFRGVTAAEESVLREQLSEQLGGIRDYGLNAARANDTAFFLSLYLLKQGYAHVDVKEQIEGGRLILNVTEGPLVTLGTIVFEGNDSIGSERLHEFLIGPTRARFSRFRGGDALPFIASDLKTGASNIRGLYLSEGFIDVEVSKPEIEFSADETVASVTVKIVEGTQYTVGKPVIMGNFAELPEQYEREIESELQNYVGKPYTPQRIVNMRRALVFALKKRGHFKAEVTQEANPVDARDGVVPVTFTLRPGPVFTFDGVEFEVEDTARLKRGFLENRFRGLHGRVYSPDELDELFRELMQTGLFAQLRIRPEPIEGNQVRLDVTVEESTAKDLGFSLGFNTFEGAFVGVSFTERNLFGTGRPISFALEVSTITYRGEILYVDRWFLETQNQLRLRAAADTTDYDSYSRFEVAALAELSRQITRPWKVAAFLLPRRVEITESEIDPEFLGAPDYFVSSVGLTSTIDYRNSILNPQSGWVFATALDVATSTLGSEVDYVRATYRFSYYKMVGPVLLAVGARGGVISNSGDEILPIDERFFTGGSRSVRSFADRELGPKDSDGDPIGGQVMAVYNAEVVVPLVGGLEAAFFVDAGSIGREVSDGFGTLRYGIGAGLRYALPVGPLRLDYGVNPDPKRFESSGAFHFSFGFAF